MQKLNKVVVEVKVEKKVDNRTNNTGRPVNKKSARQARLNNQAYLSKLNDMFVSGKSFKVSYGEYKYSQPNNQDAYGCIVSNVTGHVCNVSYIGRTKVQGYTFVLGKKVNVELNLKTLEFVKE
tara:strand:- start:4 stop:372 length:369 start_codon:yes stop_codon:yes gene_type:complete